MGRHNGLTPQKDVDGRRRSTRDRSAIYGSLDENRLFNDVLKMNGKAINEVVNQAQKLRDKEAAEVGQPLGYFRPRRSGQTSFVFGDSTDEDEELHHKKRNLKKRSDDGLVLMSSSKSSTGGSGGRRRVLLEEDEEESSARSNAMEEEAGQTTAGPYGRGCPRTTRNSGGLGVYHANEEMANDRKKKEEDERKREETGDEEVEEGEGNRDAEEEEDDVPRQYQLRRNRNPVDRFRFSLKESNRSDSLHRIQSFERQARFERRFENKMRRRNSHRRLRNNSDSMSDGEGRERRRGGSSSNVRRGRIVDDEERFEQKKERSMAKHRARFMPINLAEKDLSTSHAVIRERLRQTGGASCSDIDPMNIDLNVGFEQVGGLDSHLQSLKEVVVFPMLYPHLFSQFDINPPKGVLFYGPPGTGKTLVARALANECRKGDKKIAFFMRKGADCLSKWVGESERQLRLLFDQAYSMRPSIIFFDEIDGLAPVRSSRQDQIHASIVSTLLALMDGLDSRGEVIVIGATNRLDTLDPALRRPGRFDREMRFNLPDRAARMQILDIHTSKWNENKPDRATLEWLATSTSGYCGADLKYLCTEAVLIGLRMQYPHIYLTSDRLAVDIQKLKIAKEHFAESMRKLVPASRRDLSIPCRPLTDRTSLLLGPVIDSLLAVNIPSGYRNYAQLQSDESRTQLEKIVRALEPPLTVPSMRLLLVGNEKTSDAGQTAYVLPALLSRLDHLPVFSIAVNKIFQEGRPEESLALSMQAAVRAASTGPCIVLLPSVDEWFGVVSPSVLNVLQTALDSISGATPILFLATVNSTFQDAGDFTKKLFRASETVSIPVIKPSQRKEFFEFVLAPIYLEPKIFDPTKYEIPVKASETSGVAAAPARKLSDKEARELEKLYESQQRQFRIFLRDKLNRVIRDRRFSLFVMPVDVEDAEDYYEVIKNPLCLTEILDKIDRREYVHPDEFLSDIRLIMANALEYNPNVSQEDKLIRHAAIGLKEAVEDIFDTELDEEFVGAMETTSRLLSEAALEPANDRLISLPDGFQRTEKWSVNDYAMKRNGSAILKAKAEKEMREAGEVMDSSETPTSKAIPTTPPPRTSNSAAATPHSLTLSRKRKHRAGGYNFPSSSSKKKKAKQIVKKLAESLKSSTALDSTQESSGQEDGLEEKENEEEEINEEQRGETQAEELGNEEERRQQPQTLVIDRKRVERLAQKCVELSTDWSIDELERLAARITQEIEIDRETWNRIDLLGRLEKLVSAWTFH